MAATHFTKAIVRIPGSNFAEGLTTAELGAPNYELAFQQHARYCDALRECGLQVTVLPADLRYPDSTFVEDAAVLTAEAAILTRPGAASRAGEVEAIAAEIRGGGFPSVLSINEPGTLDGGDICEVGRHFFLGLSLRSNEEGVQQLGMFLEALGYTASVVDIREMQSILHLKSGIAYIGENTLVVWEEMADLPQFQGYELIRVSPDEHYGANCVRVNDCVLVAEGFPKLTAELECRAFKPLLLEMSEFEKMDGGLSCLSLRF
ncbi:amidinotransferase [Candidatus Koribacter versatilis Ellin345]|uniref:Amidinotransferase n=1 Tax=Koribacter versatilis (strain Ellin345) TaxID=204669 RepID=Q1IJ56_KORVE|nr:arginine deiminase-related protein [Candidatus Koribacter versatilis]ABF43094.1 amidinotransferase [Candidatus Koribacter versatilis Ellin345]